MLITSNSRIKYSYYLQLRQIDPSIKDDLKIIELDSLFENLNKKILDIQLLERMSKDLDWNFQEVLIKQVIYLNFLKPKFDSSVSFNSTKMG